MNQLTRYERQFVALVVGGIPAFVIGLFCGLWVAQIGGRELGLATVLLRGACCSVFPVILAGLLMPRSWILPTLVYLCGVTAGFCLLDVFAGVPELFLEIVHRLEGRRMTAAFSAHPDLPWVLGIALWLAGAASILRQSARFAAVPRHPEIRHEGGDGDQPDEEI